MQFYVPSMPGEVKYPTVNVCACVPACVCV